MSQTRRHPQVVNLDEVDAREEKTGDFDFQTRRLGATAGARALGCSHYEVGPGKTTFPFHFHSAIEEAIFVLDGTATLRIGQERVDLRAGDYVAIPPGPASAHALVGGPTGVRYLCLSAPATPMTLDITGYPDSKKIGLAAGIDPAKGFASAWIRKIIKEDQPEIGYYDGEPLAKK